MRTSVEGAAIFKKLGFTVLSLLLFKLKCWAEHLSNKKSVRPNIYTPLYGPNKLYLSSLSYCKSLIFVSQLQNWVFNGFTSGFTLFLHGFFCLISFFTQLRLQTWFKIMKIDVVVYDSTIQFCKFLKFKP